MGEEPHNSSQGLITLNISLMLHFSAILVSFSFQIFIGTHNMSLVVQVCDLPFVFFSDPDLMPVLAGTLVAACFGSEQNKGVVQQELSIEMLISLLKSCKSGSPTSQSCPIDASTESTQSGPDSRKLHGDSSQQRSNRRITRVQSVKSGALGNNNRNMKIRNQKDGGKTITRVCDSNSESCSNLMLYSRFPASFIDKAELFFSTETPVYM